MGKIPGIKEKTPGCPEDKHSKHSKHGGSHSKHGKHADKHECYHGVSVGDLIVDSHTCEIKVKVCGGVVGIGDWVKTNFAPITAYRILGIKLLVDLPVLLILDDSGKELTPYVLAKAH